MRPEHRCIDTLLIHDRLVVALLRTVQVEIIRILSWPAIKHANRAGPGTIFYTEVELIRPLSFQVLVDLLVIVGAIEIVFEL